MDVGTVKIRDGEIEVLGDLVSRDDRADVPVALLYMRFEFGENGFDITIPGVDGEFWVKDLIIRGSCELTAEEVEELIPMLRAAVTPVDER